MRKSSSTGPSSTRASGRPARIEPTINRPDPVRRGRRLQPRCRDVFVHASIETDTDGNDDRGADPSCDLAPSTRPSADGQDHSDPVCSAAYLAAASRWTTPWPLTIYPTQEFDATKNMVSLADGAAPWVSTFLAYNAVAQFTGLEPGRPVGNTTGSATQILEGTERPSNARLIWPTTSNPVDAGLSSAPTALYDAYQDRPPPSVTPFFFEDAAPTPTTNQRADLLRPADR